MDSNPAETKVTYESKEVSAKNFCAYYQYLDELFRPQISQDETEFKALLDIEEYKKALNMGFVKKFKEMFKKWMKFHSKYTNEYEDKGVVNTGKGKRLVQRTNIKLERLEPKKFEYLNSIYYSDNIKAAIPKGRWNVIVSNQFWYDLSEWK